MTKSEKKLKGYTYLGCPLTKNRSAWCFRICRPDSEGHGFCGRYAPHAIKSRIQEGIEDYLAKKPIDIKTNASIRYDKVMNILEDE